jgi:hypothetical protein
MKTKTYKGWSDFFRKFLARYAELSTQTREQLASRGQADARWSLLTSLDRVASFSSAAEREQCLEKLIRQFRQQARRSAELKPETDLEWELLGRHHGLPTSVLDFTTSPYVAAYFAFAEPLPTDATHASIWVLDRERLSTDPILQVAIIDKEELIRFNPRAQEQQGLFLKMKEVGPIESVLSDCLERHDIAIDNSQRTVVLAALDGMLISARKLFGDLDGAARTAAVNVMVLGRG